LGECGYDRQLGWNLREENIQCQCYSKEATRNYRQWSWRTISIRGRKWKCGEKIVSAGGHEHRIELDDEKEWKDDAGNWKEMENEVG